MDTGTASAYCAVMIEIVVAIIFMGQRVNLKRWTYWTLMMMVVVMIFRTYLLAVDFCYLAKLTSILVAAQLLAATLQFRKTVNSDKQLFNKLDRDKRSLSHLLAEHMTNTREKLRYYEKQAAEHSLPLYNDLKNGG